MQTVLAIFFLAIKSSYRENIELEATEDEFDTVQFFGGECGNWRIKTFAHDQDVHVWSLGDAIEDLIAVARANTEKHYGDVLTEGYLIETDEGIEGIREGLKERGLPAHLESAEAGFVFWTPEGTKYRTKSKPQ